MAFTTPTGRPYNNCQFKVPDILRNRLVARPTTDCSRLGNVRSFHPPLHLGRAFSAL